MDDNTTIPFSKAPDEWLSEVIRGDLPAVEPVDGSEPQSVEFCVMYAQRLLRERSSAS